MARIIFSFTAAAVAVIGVAQAASAAGDPVVGAKLFIQCRACHTVDAGDRNGVGPNLHAIVGRRSASREGYDYSPAMAASGIVWTPASLDRFLTRPSAMVSGTKMAFAGIAARTGRDDIIAYLASVGTKR